MVSYDSSLRRTYTPEEALNKTLHYFEQGIRWDLTVQGGRFQIPSVVPWDITEAEVLEAIDRGSLAPLNATRESEETLFLAEFYTDVMSIAESLNGIRRTGNFQQIE